MVKLPARLLDRPGVPAGKTVTLRFGGRRIRARLRGERRLPPGEAHIPASRAGELGVRGGVRIGTWREGEGTLTFGPLIGCVDSRGLLNNMEAGKATADFVRMATAARGMGGLGGWQA